MSIKIEDVMTRSIVLSQTTSNVSEIAKLMTRHSISSIVIENNNKLVGIVTHKDIIEKIVAIDKNPKETLIAEIMSTPVVTISTKAEIEEAARIMRDKKIKKIVATNNGRAEGIISSFDIVVAEPILRLLIERGI